MVFRRDRRDSRWLGVLAGIAGLLAAASPAIFAQNSRAPAADARIPGIDAAVDAAIKASQTPGAVVLVGQGDRVLHFQAYGVKASVPAREAMTLDTVFDLASLTKVIATTTSVMTLVEQGRVRLNDPVSTYVPGFERYGKGGVTVGHLMAHVSGLRPDLDLAEPWRGYDTAIELARDEVLTSPPGDRFVYSDINFLLLGEIVRVVSGERLDVYARSVVFAPLGMRDTGFLPAESLRSADRTDRTVPRDGRLALQAAGRRAASWRRPRSDRPQDGWRRGSRRLVRDRAGHRAIRADVDRRRHSRRRPGSCPGHCRPDDLARHPARDEGRARPGLGHRHARTRHCAASCFRLARSAIPASPARASGSIPASSGYVIIMASRLYPDGGGDMTPLRARVATIAAAAMTDLSSAPRPATPVLTTGTVSAPAPAAPILTGIDVLARDQFAPLKGRKVGLLTNHTGIDRQGTSTIDVLRKGLGAGLVALFSPEHGIRGTRDDEHVESDKDATTGLIIHSLYGEHRRPTDDMLRGIDTIVVDLADVGARFYTYYLTMAWVMEEAAARKIAVMVLDRPNPINGWQIEGPVPPASTDFLGYHPMPVRHGLTMGELARLFNGERMMGVDLTVIAGRGLGARRVVRSDRAAVGEPLAEHAEPEPGHAVSGGRRDRVLEHFGWPRHRPALRADRCAVDRRRAPGRGAEWAQVARHPVLPCEFTPASSKYANQSCQGVFMIVTDHAALQPVRVGLEIAGALARLFGDAYQIENTDRLLGSRDSLERVLRGEDPAVVAASWAAGEARWRQTRAKYLLYK